jgi:hypothetical protein
MPTIADYTIISEKPGHASQGNGDIDHEFSFRAPAVNAGSRSILAFGVNPSTEDVTVQLTLNGTEILTQTFNSDPQRSWHEVIQANLLQTNNKLTVTRTAGPGEVSVSNLLLYCQVDI